MKQITPLLWMWSHYRPAERLDRNAYFVQRAAGEPGALVDPVALHDGDREQLLELGGVAAVVLTGRDGEREREAARFTREFGCAVHTPAAMTEGAALPGGLIYSMLPGVAAQPGVL